MLFDIHGQWKDLSKIQEEVYDKIYKTGDRFIVTDGNRIDFNAYIVLNDDKFSFYTAITNIIAVIHIDMFNLNIYKHDGRIEKFKEIANLRNESN